MVSFGKKRETLGRGQICVYCRVTTFLFVCIHANLVLEGAQGYVSTEILDHHNPRSDTDQMGVGCMPNGLKCPRLVPYYPNSKRRGATCTVSPYSDGMGILENIQGADSGESKLKVWGSQEPQKKKGKKKRPHIPFQMTYPRHLRPCAINVEPEDIPCRHIQL